MQSMQVIYSGWQRKRPKVRGPWRSRYIVIGRYQEVLELKGEGGEGKDGNGQSKPTSKTRTATGVLAAVFHSSIKELEEQKEALRKKKGKEDRESPYEYEIQVEVPLNDAAQVVKLSPDDKTSAVFEKSVRVNNRPGKSRERVYVVRILTKLENEKLSDTDSHGDHISETVTTTQGSPETSRRRRGSSGKSNEKVNTVNSASRFSQTKSQNAKNKPVATERQTSSGPGSGSGSLMKKISRDKLKENSTSSEALNSASSATSHSPSKIDASQTASPSTSLTSADFSSQMKREKKRVQSGDSPGEKCGVLLTMGAQTPEEAQKIKSLIEAEIKSLNAREDAQAIRISARKSRVLSKPGGEFPYAGAHVGGASRTLPGRGPQELQQQQDENWHVVDMTDGIQVKGEKIFTKRFPTIRASTELPASGKLLFELLTSNGSNSNVDSNIWDEGIESHRVVRSISTSAEIVHLVVKPIWVGLTWAQPRDLIMMRYWREETDPATGESYYMVFWQSIEDFEVAEAPEGCVRAKVFSMALQVNPVDETSCNVEFSCHADPGGNFSWAPNMVIQQWMIPFATRMVGIRKALVQARRRVSKRGLAVPSTSLSTEGTGMTDGAAVGDKSTLAEEADDDDDDEDIELPTPSPVKLKRDQSVQSSSLLGSQTAEATAKSQDAIIKEDIERAAAEGESGVEHEQTPMKMGTMPPELWDQTPESEPFNVRGKNYLEDGKKYPTKAHRFFLVATDFFKLNEQTFHLAARSDSPIKKIQEKYPGRFIFVLQYALPGPYAMVIYAVAKEGMLDDNSPFAELFSDFIDGTDEYRDTRFKFIPRVVKGPWLVKQSVGTTPAILGRKLKLHYFVSKERGYMEIDVDVGSSQVGASILSMVKGYSRKVGGIDLAFCLEGHSSAELPEEIMFSFRVKKPDLSRTVPIPDDPNPDETRRNIQEAETLDFDVAED